MNLTMISGTVGRDAELRHTQSQDAVLNFSVAVDNGKDKNGNKRDATWFDCSVWGKRGEALQNYIRKGTKLTLVGRVSAREHNGKAYLQIAVNELTFQGGNDKNYIDDPNEDHAPQQNYQPQVGGFQDDEIPF